jgi:putative aldouronate transport system permease protein
MGSSLKRPERPRRQAQPYARLAATGYRGRSFGKKVARHWQLYVVIAVPLLFLAVFSYAPMYGAILAFKQFSASRGILRSPWVGLTNFRLFFSTASSWQMIQNTLVIGLYSIGANILPPVILAIGLNEARNTALKKTVQLVTYAPFFISTVVMVSIIIQILDLRIGVVNKLVLLLGGKAMNYMGEARIFKSLYVWTGVWQSTGYGAIIYLAALTGVDPGLYEAAVIDGASKVQRILHIDVPSILPTLSILLILNFGQVMNVGFEKIFLMQNPANVTASEVISTYVYKVGMVSMNYAFSTAVGLFNSAVNLVLLGTVNAVARRVGETSLW